jgi:hypothetical protein
MANVEFEEFSASVKDLMSELLGNALEEVGAEIESQAARNTRVDSGETKRKWDHEVKQNNEEASVTIGNPLENAIWEEFGTGTYALNGDGRKGGWYILADDAPELAKYNMKVVYGKDGKKFYYTKGKPPSRALYKAWMNNKETIEKRIGDVLKELND